MYSNEIPHNFGVSKMYPGETPVLDAIGALKFCLCSRGTLVPVPRYIALRDNRYEAGSEKINVKCCIFEIKSDLNQKQRRIFLLT